MTLHIYPCHIHDVNEEWLLEAGKARNQKPEKCQVRAVTHIVTNIVKICTPMCKYFTILILPFHAFKVIRMTVTEGHNSLSRQRTGGRCVYSIVTILGSVQYKG